MYVCAVYSHFISPPKQYHMPQPGKRSRRTPPTHPQPRQQQPEYSIRILVATPRSAVKETPPTSERAQGHHYHHHRQHNQSPSRPIRPHHPRHLTNTLSSHPLQFSWPWGRASEIHGSHKSKQTTAGPTRDRRTNGQRRAGQGRGAASGGEMERPTTAANGEVGGLRDWLAAFRTVTGHGGGDSEEVRDKPLVQSSSTWSLARVRLGFFVCLSMVGWGIARSISLLVFHVDCDFDCGDCRVPGN